MEECTGGAFYLSLDLIYCNVDAPSEFCKSGLRNVLLDLSNFAFTSRSGVCEKFKIEVVKKQIEIEMSKRQSLRTYYVPL